MRLVRPLALVLAAFLAGALAVFPTFFALGALMERRWPAVDADMIVYLAVAYVLLLALCCVPVAGVVALAEWRRIRHWAYFALAGGLTAIVLIVLLGFLPQFGVTAVDTKIAVLLVAGGLAAGLTYWAIAGRRAGALLDAWNTERAPS